MLYGTVSEIQPPDSQVTSALFGLPDELGYHSCVLQATRVSGYSSFLHRCVDILGPQQEVGKFLGHNAEEDYALSTEKGDYLKLVNVLRLLFFRYVPSAYRLD